jgi:transcriptional regulator with XRE-family HTH domain
MMNLRRIRAFLELRQSDVERATGITVRRLSAAESGKCRLNRTEQQLIESFFIDRLRVVGAIEGSTPRGSNDGASVSILGHTALLN